MQKTLTKEQSQQIREIFEFESQYVFLNDVQRKILLILLRNSKPINAYNLRLEIYREMIVQKILELDPGLMRGFSFVENIFGNKLTQHKAFDLAFDKNNLTSKESQEKINLKDLKEKIINRLKGIPGLRQTTEKEKENLYHILVADYKTSELEELYIDWSKMLRLEFPSNRKVSTAIQFMKKEFILNVIDTGDKRGSGHVIDSSFRTAWMQRKNELLKLLKEKAILEDSLMKTSKEFWNL